MALDPHGGMGNPFNPQALQNLVNSTPEQRDAVAQQLAAHMPPPPPGALDQFAPSANPQAPGPRFDPRQTQVPQIPGDVQGQAQGRGLNPMQMTQMGVGMVGQGQQPGPQTQQLIPIQPAPQINLANPYLAQLGG